MPELTCEQVNERLAALCHWYTIEVDVMNGGFGEADGPVTREVRWQKGARTSPYYRERTTPPDYCHDINACAEAEREIAEWGLGSKYAVAIGRMLNIRRPLFWCDIFTAMTASPETRARALLKVLEE